MPGRLASALGSGSRPNLRRRAALTVGALTTVVVLVFGVTSWIVVAHSLRAAVDDDLRSVVNALQQSANAGEHVLPPQDGRFGEFETTTMERPPVPYIEVLDGQGVSMAGRLPPTEFSVEVATGARGDTFETLRLERQFIRVLTVPAQLDSGAGALRVGIDMTNIVGGLHQARAGTALVGVMAGLLSAAIAWLLGGRIIAPVAAVTAAADHLRRNRELPDRLEGEGDNELGWLVRSFNALLDDLRQSRDRQQRLAADAGHELRTPLTSLRIKIEFIRSSPELPIGERQQMLDGAVADVASLSDLVSELVELAAEGTSTERAGLVDLAELVESTVHQFRTTTGRTVQVWTSAGMVETRPRQAARALMNLLVNADKFSPSNEPIVVTQDGPRIAVRDHGPGIPVEERDLVFDRFHRGRSHQSIDGSGLGLAIVESVAEANGGTTWIADAPDGRPGVVVGFSVGPTPIR